MCLAEGYFPDVRNCSIFYRCTDIWNNSIYQQYTFECAPGTVFDDRYGKYSVIIPYMYGIIDAGLRLRPSKLSGFRL
jgi:hypothetical protein